MRPEVNMYLYFLTIEVKFTTFVYISTELSMKYLWYEKFTYISFQFFIGYIMALKC